MEFKRIENAINDLETIKRLDEITESGLEYLEELKLILSIYRSSLQLKDKKKINFLDWKEDNIDVFADYYLDKRDGDKYYTSNLLYQAYHKEILNL